MLPTLPLFQEFSETYYKLTGQVPSFTAADSDLGELLSTTAAPFLNQRENGNGHSPAIQSSADGRTSIEPAGDNNTLLIRRHGGILEHLVPLTVRQMIVGHLHSGAFLVTTDPAIARVPSVQENGSSNGNGHSRAMLTPPRCEPERFEAIGNLLSIFAELIGDWLHSRGHDLQSDVPFHARRAIAIIRQRSHENLTLTGLADEVGVSPNYLTGMLSRYTGKSFRRHLCECRIANAKSLLKTSPKTIAEVAYAVGFQSLSQFNRSFRDLAKESPSMYRRRKALQVHEDPPLSEN